MELSTHAVHEDTDQLADLQRKLEDDDEDEDADDGDKKSKKMTPTTASANSNQIDTTSYDYLINMSLRNLTKERRDDILKDQKEKHDKLEALQKKSPEDLYEDDLLNFENEYQKVKIFHRLKSSEVYSSFRHWKKNKRMRCPMLPIQPRRKQLVQIKHENDNQSNLNVLKRNQHHMVNVLHQLLIQH